MRDVCFATLPLLFAGNSLAIDGVRLCHQVIWSDTPRMVAQMAELRGPQYPAMSDHIHKSVSIERACRLPGQLGTHAAICPTGTLPQLTAQLIWATVCEYFISHGQTKIFWKFLSCKILVESNIEALEARYIVFHGYVFNMEDHLDSCTCRIQVVYHHWKSLYFHCNVESCRKLTKFYQSISHTFLERTIFGQDPQQHLIWG